MASGGRGRCGVTVLEDRYRKVLRILPSSYRREWEDEMVATFVASMETDDPEENEYLAEFGRPSVAEVASVSALAVRLRLGGVEAPPRSFLWGEAMRRVALVGLLGNATISMTMWLRDMWLAGGIPWSSPPAELQAFGETAPLDVWTWALWLCSMASIPAYFAVVWNYPTVAKVLAAVSLVRPVVRVSASAVGAFQGGPPMEYYWVAQLVAGAACLLAMAAFHREAPSVRRRPWILAFAIALVAGVLVEAVFLLTQSLDRRILLDLPGVARIAVVVAASVHLVRTRRHAPPMASSWSLALATLALVALVQRGVAMLDYTLVGHPPGAYDAQMALAVVEALLLAAVVVPLSVLGVRALRRLPASPVHAR
jgi:hypothetical protein